GDGGTSPNYDTTVTVSAVNDAPVLADTALTLTVGEDAGVPSGAVGSLVSAFTGGISDVDSGASKGIAITGSNQTNGTWYYTRNGGTTWTAVGTVSNTSALLLADNASTRLYFAPNANYNGTSSAALTVRAWDQTSGTAGTKVSTASNGGTTAFSSATDTVDVTVTAVNDASTITSLSGDSLAYSEGAVAVVIEQGGNALVADIDSTNFDTGTLTVSLPAGGDAAEDVLSIRHQGTGVGQIGVSGSTVTYQGVTIGTFTGGSSGSNLVIPLNSNATPTAVTALVRNITYQNTDTNAPTTGARTGRFVLTDGDGGTSPNYNTTVTVSAVNDAPVLADTALTLTVGEDAGVPSGAVGSLVSAFTGGISDVDSGASKGIAITGSNQTNGVWYYTTNGGTTWTAVGSVSNTSALLLADNGSARLYFAPNANYNGTSTAALTVRAWDQTSGTAGTKVSTASNGGTTAFSSATDTVDVTVTAVNDATVVTGGTSGTGTEDTGLTGTLTATDVEGLSDGTVFSVSTPATNGTASIDPATGLWSYTPNPDYHGSDSFTVTLTDDAGNSSTQVISVTVTPVNDAPVLSANTGTTVAEGETNTIDSSELAVTDVDNTAAQLTYSIGTGPAYGRLELTTAPDLSATTFTQADIAANRLVYVHNGSETTSDSFTFTVSDGAGGTLGPTTMTLTITPVNDAPTMTSNGGGATAASNVAENVSAVTIVTGADVDLPAQALTYSISGGVDQALFTINTATGELSFTAPPNFEVAMDANGDNIYVVQVRVIDSQGASTTQAIQVTVTDVAEGLPPIPTTPLIPPVLLPTTPTGPTGPGPVPSSPSGPPAQTTDVPPPLPLGSGLSASPPEFTPTSAAPAEAERLNPFRPEEPRERIDVVKDSVLFHWIDETRRLFLTGIPEQATPTPEATPDKESQSVSDLLFSKLDEMTASLERAMGVSQEQHAITARIVALTGTTLSAGFIAWALRSGTLLASFMATMPAWRHFDPLPVLGGSRSERERRRKEAEQDQHAEATEFKGLKHLLDLGLPPDPKP
ncbi:MAG: tandem-95 repeat protein, partial [Nitrospira sp.]